MGKGIDAARYVAPEHAAVMEAFRDDLIIALVVKAGGRVRIKVAEVDRMGGYVLMLAVRDGEFVLEARRKQ